MTKYLQELRVQQKIGKKEEKEDYGKSCEENDRDYEDLPPQERVKCFKNNSTTKICQKIVTQSNQQIFQCEEASLSDVSMLPRALKGKGKQAQCSKKISVDDVIGCMTKVTCHNY